MRYIIFGMVAGLGLILGCTRPPNPSPTPFLIWPVSIEEICGAGCEDPNYPPGAWQCPPVGYRPVPYRPAYNGHNWICVADGPQFTELPRVEGYPLGWSPAPKIGA